MASLTNHTRGAITKAAVAHAFDKAFEDSLKAEDGLAREAYASVIPTDETRLVAKVPANWFRLDACLRFNVAGLSLTLRLIGDGLPVPYRRKNSDHGGYSCSPLGAIQQGDLSDRIQAHANELEELKRRRAAAERQVSMMLGGITTFKRLREAWPEGLPFYERYESRPAVFLPVVRVDEVNAALGLIAA